MEPYDFALGAEAIHAFTAQPARRRERLLQVFDELARHPFSSGDYRERGLSGREYHVRLWDDQIVTWWVDHAAREVRVVRLEWA
ncbi:MAG: hypothetical protein RLZZ15_2376 [Verrucomicrobiota bacterium]|jgi:hypothetical protein